MDERPAQFEPEAPGDLSGLAIEDLRAMRDERVEVETGLSYLRRLVQGPLDVVRFEQQSRAGGEPRDAQALVEALPEVLGDPRVAKSVGRIPTTLSPKVVPQDLEDEVAALTSDRRLLDVAELLDSEMDDLGAKLVDLERRVSQRRRHMHSQIDALQEEIARRYATGEATVDSVLGNEVG